MFLLGYFGTVKPPAFGSTSRWLPGIFCWAEPLNPRKPSAIKPRGHGKTPGIEKHLRKTMENHGNAYFGGGKPMENPLMNFMNNRQNCQMKNC
jgi:hypothetical protein